MTVHAIAAKGAGTSPTRRHAVAGLRSLARAWPEAIIVIAVLIAFRPTITGSAHIPFDAEFFHFPLELNIQSLLSSGTLPSWDPYSYGGIPLLANAQSAWLYPPNLMLDGVLTAIGRPLTEHTLDMVAVVHVAIAGLGTAAVVRARNLGGAAAAFAGVFVVLNGSTVSQAQHVLMTATYAWLPLAVLVVDRLGFGITGRRVAALGALVALMVTAGFLPLVASCVAMLVAVAAARGSGRTSALVGTCAGIVLGFALAAVMLIPAVAVLGTLVPLPPHPALPTSWLITAVLPTVLGHWGTAAQWTGPALTNSYFYLGGAALVLLPIALTSGRAALADAGVVLIFLLATFGAVGQRIADVIQSLPTVGTAWRPEDAVYVAAVPLALLLARGLARAPSPRQLGAAALLILVLVVVPLSWDSHVYHGLTSIPVQTALALLLVAALLTAAAVAVSRPATAALLLALAAGVGCVELAVSVPDRFFVNSPGPATSADANHVGDGSGTLTFLRRHLRNDERVIVDAVNLPATWTGFPPVWKLADANGFQPEFSKYQLARVQATGAAFQSNRIFPVSPRMARYFDEMDVRFLIVNEANAGFVRRRGYTLVYSSPPYRVYRNDAVLARAYAVDPRCVARRGTLALITCRQGPSVSFAQTSPSGDTLMIGSAAGVPLLVTGEPWYPGWSASTGRGPLPVRRVGYLAAVSVPRGVRTVKLTYSPPGLLAGLVLSALALVVTVLLVLWPAPIRRPRADRPDAVAP